MTSSMLPASGCRAALELVHAAWERSLPGKKLRVISVPAPLGAAEQLLSVEPTAEAVLWAPHPEAEWAGIGCTAMLGAQGATRFADVKLAAEALWADVDSSAHFGSGLPVPRLFGGFAFRTGTEPHAEWQTFGEARFLLPKLVYVRAGGAAHFQLSLPSPERTSAGERATVYAWLEKAWSLLEAPAAPGVQHPPAAAFAAPSLAAPFRNLVIELKAAILRGEFQKVVLSRCLRLAFEQELSPVAVLRHLRKEAKECTRFALRLSGNTFLGASPEQLIRKQALRIFTTALAGSVDARAYESLERLHGSVKDHEEHAFVAREIVRLLSPLTSSIEAAESPDIQKLRHVLHLKTPISGTLREPGHVLDLVELLHPTPAVGGVPREAALAWLAEHERDGRGFYAGPFGWFDAAGDGEFIVALRSGLFSGAQALLYAGAGIVAQSDPETEYQETGWKLRTLLGALGVDEWP